MGSWLQCFNNDNGVGTYMGFFTRGFFGGGGVISPSRELRSDIGEYWRMFGGGVVWIVLIGGGVVPLIISFGCRVGARPN